MSTPMTDLITRIEAGSLSAADIDRIVAALGDVAREDIEWSQRLGLPDNAEDFALETIFVICNSGMKNTVARRIYERICGAISIGRSASTVFNHKGKSAAIDAIWRDREKLWGGLLAASEGGDESQLAFIAALPWIGNITKYHLAKNFGADVAKPDVHLQRLADREGCTPQQLCERLAKETGYRIATIDTLLWRACANGVIDSAATLRAHAALKAKETSDAE